MRKVTALFVGRFQPFHKGHLHAIKYILANFDEVVIGIGTSNKSDTSDNPFSFEERKTIIEESGIKFKIIPVEDRDDDKEWVKSIAKKVDFDVVVTGNDWTKNCFLTFGYKVMEPNFLEPEKYKAAKIRGMMLKGDNSWKELVPEGALKVLRGINIKERLKG